MYGLKAYERHEGASKESMTTMKDAGGVTSSAGMFGLATVVDVPDIFSVP